MASASWRFRIMRSTPKGRDNPVFDHIVTLVVTRRGVCKSTKHNRHDGKNSTPSNYNATVGGQALGVHGALGDAVALLVRNGHEQVKALHLDRAQRPRGQRF